MRGLIVTVKIGNQPILDKVKALIKKLDHHNMYAQTAVVKVMKAMRRKNGKEFE